MAVLYFVNKLFTLPFYLDLMILQKCMSSSSFLCIICTIFLTLHGITLNDCVKCSFIIYHIYFLFIIDAIKSMK